MRTTKDTLPLTVIILTDRSDRRFLASLASAQLAQEVIVVDNNSGNDWEKLAKKYQFSVTKYEQPVENFAQVRNFALDMATLEWVLFLDSDETLADNAHSAIKEVILGDLYDGVMVTRQDVFLGKKLQYGEAGTMQLLRLFKKDLTHFNRAIHEVAKVNGKVGSSDVILYHYAHTTISEFISDISWYAERVAEQRRFDSVAFLFQLLLYPPGKFVLNYLVKLGFLDGWRGLIYAVIMSLHSFSVRCFMYEQHRYE